MRRRVFLLATTIGALVRGFTALGREALAGRGKPDLVLVGTVSSIAQGGSLLKPWIVTIDVEKVLSAELSDPTFSFAIHSPARAGLQKRQSYTIHAVWRGNGYEVNETDRPKPIPR